MKALTILVLLTILCSSCTALPAEERAFAVALCVEKADAWRVHGRVPTYQTGGGYMTVTGEGDTFPAALADLDAASPMRINLSQLRLLVIDDALTQNNELLPLLTSMAERPDMRLECTVALTDAPAKDIAEALKPAAGSRLSKALDLMLDARVEQGSILPATLADVLRMGERQSPVLAGLSLDGQDVSLYGGYTLDGLRLTSDETALLSLILGYAKSPHLTLSGGSADVRDVSAKVRLSEDCTSARVELTMTATASTFGENELEQVLISELLPLLTRLSAAGCDALGLGRQAVMHTHDMAEWHAFDWQERYQNLRWEVAVGVNGLT